MRPISPATWSLNSPSPATANVTITSSTGQTAYTGTVSLNAGTQTYSWNGQGTNGVTWPAGQYTIAVSATGANGQAVTVSTQVQGTVSGVNLSHKSAAADGGRTELPDQRDPIDQQQHPPAVSAISTAVSARSTAVISSLSQLL